MLEAIQRAAADAEVRCRRADDIWEAPAIIQDVVNLIDRSRIVVCDCTERNPNVFYETGIAHIRAGGYVDCSKCLGHSI